MAGCKTANVVLDRYIQHSDVTINGHLGVVAILGIVVSA